MEVPTGQEQKLKEALILGLATEENNPISSQAQEVLNKPKLDDDDVIVDPYPAVDIEPSLLERIPFLGGFPFYLDGAGKDAVTTEQIQDSAKDSEGITRVY